MRELSKSRYLIAGLLTGLILLSGIVVGELLDEWRRNYLKIKLEEERVEYSDIQTQYYYLFDATPEKFCKVASPALKENLERLSELLNKLDKFKASSDFNQEEYRLLKREYTISNLRYWMLLEKVKENCGRNDVSILYFYDEKCDVCPRQGFVLTQLRNRYEGKLWIFPIDKGLDENMIDILETNYKVTEVPSLVVNDEVYKSFQPYDKLDRIVVEKLYNTTNS